MFALHSGPLPKASADRELAQPVQTTESTPQRIPRWLVRSELLLRAILRIYLGMLVCYLPWSAQLPIFLPWSRYFWEMNPLLTHFHLLAHYAANGAVRGAVSGLGLLNIWVALEDAIQHWNE